MEPYRQYPGESNNRVRVKTESEAERIGKYMIRPVLSLEPLSLDERTGQVRYLYGNWAMDRCRISNGEVHVAAQVVGFKKIKLFTQENVGAGGLFGLAYLLHHVSPLFMMCDLHDVGVSVGDNLTGESVPPRDLPLRVATFDENPVFIEPEFEPNIFIYDNFPGGIGLSPALFDLEKDLLRHSLKTINVCPCQEGCPSCVGPSRETGRQAKRVSQEILGGLQTLGSAGHKICYN